MNNRFLLYVAFSLVLFMIWQQWKIEQNPIANNTIENTQENTQENTSAQDLPDEGYSSQNRSLENNQEQRKSKIQ